MTHDDTLARGPLVQVRAPMLAIRERQQAAIARLGLRALAGTAVDELLDAVVDTLAGELELEHAGSSCSPKATCASAPTWGGATWSTERRSCRPQPTAGPGLELEA